MRRGAESPGWGNSLVVFVEEREGLIQESLALKPRIGRRAQVDFQQRHIHVTPVLALLAVVLAAIPAVHARISHEGDQEEERRRRTALP